MWSRRPIIHVDHQKNDLDQIMINFWKSDHDHQKCDLDQKVITIILACCQLCDPDNTTSTLDFDRLQETIDIDIKLP